MQTLSFDSAISISDAFPTFLPDPDFDGINNPDHVILPFFADTIIRANTTDGVFTYANETLFAMEFHVTNKADLTEQYVYKIEYLFDTPGHWVFTYLDIPVCGSLTRSAVVGIQGAESSKFSSFPFSFCVVLRCLSFIMLTVNSVYPIQCADYAGSYRYGH
jgi:hypothetical protein